MLRFEDLQCCLLTGFGFKVILTHSNRLPIIPFRHINLSCSNQLIGEDCWCWHLLVNQYEVKSFRFDG